MKAVEKTHQVETSSLHREAVPDGQADKWLEIFSIFIHDLESPLASMKYLLKLIESGKLNLNDPIHARMVASSRIAVDRAESILYDVLSVAKSGQAGLPVTLSSVNADEIIREVVTLAQGSAAERDVAVTAVPSGSRCQVSADPALLRRVLDNLLYNAIRHTPGGGSIQVYAEQGENSVFISVKDSGPGLGDVDHASLFDKYGQVQARLDGNHRGVGLGLYFCKLAATGMGGTVLADDHAEGGAVFSIKLQKITGEKI
ncbi:MAG: HAMP domain-containing sensor histidine kinase [Candidatus Zixiibacteriota bacterium]